MCHACAAIEETRTARKDPPPGLKLYAALPPGFDLERARADREAAMAAELASVRKG